MKQAFNIPDGTTTGIDCNMRTPGKKSAREYIATRLIMEFPTDNILGLQPSIIKTLDGIMIFLKQLPK